jgi:uncharacterized protein (TIGR02001 family)
VIALAVSWSVGGAARARRLLLGACIGLLPGLMAASPAAAQLAGSVGIDSDYRIRGYSLTDGHPALSAQMTYDDPSGVYASVSALTELSRDTRFLGMTAAAGYAKRLNRHVTIDGGVLRSQIRAAAPGGLGFDYTEIYAGAYVGPVRGVVYYSPEYRTGSQSTLYGELETGFEPLRKWRLSGHVGFLTYLTASTFYRAGDTHRDWRLSVARQLGKVELHASLSQGNPDNYYGYRPHRKAAFTVGASAGF